jgi:hypothetical protein
MMYSMSPLNQGKAWWSLLAYYYYTESDKEFTDKVFFAAQLAGIWGIERLLQVGTGAVMQTPLARAVWLPVVAGGVVSYAIAGDEGIKNYEEFLTEPTKMPERIAFTVTKITPGTKTVKQNKITQGYHARVLANLKAIQLNNLRYQYTGSHADTEGPLFDINNPNQPNTFRPGTTSISEQVYEEADIQPYAV